MGTSRLGMITGVALTALVAACGGDDSGTGSSGSGGSSSDAGGSGGSSADAGGSGGTSADAGGAGGSGGTTTSGGSDAGGSAGEGTDSGGTAGIGGTGGTGGRTGTGGSAGSAGAPVDEFAPITEVTEVVIEEVNELRGMTYSTDGKIWASGFTDVDETDRQLVIVRFTADGELDTTFDEDGILIHNAAVGGGENSRGIVELENGDIIVQANIADGNGGDEVTDDGGGDPVLRPDGVDVVLLRFDSEGALVTDFGTNGMAMIDFGWDAVADASWPAPTYDSTLDSPWSGPGFPQDESWGIALDSASEEEKIVVFGYGPAAAVSVGEQRFDNDRYVARVLASDGSPDPDFNGGSVFTLDSPGSFPDNARRGIVEPDGSILSSGYTNFGTGFGNHVLLLRLLEDGTPDAGFGFGIAVPGLTRFNPFVDDGGFAECYAAAPQSDGRIVTTGYGRATGDNMSSKYGYATSTAQDVVSFGVQSDGLDLDWGNLGTLAIQSEEAGLGDTQDRGRDLVVLGDDRVVHAGRFGPYPTLFVTTPNGELDTSVGDLGSGRFSYEPLVIGDDAGAGTSHFFVIAANADKTRIAAATSEHPAGVTLAILEVGEQ